MADPDWLPELYVFAGDWNSFIDEVYDIFLANLVHNKVLFQGLRVGVRRHPESRGKGYGFWHCVSEGGLEDERAPDLERCKRIGWIRAIIENGNKPEVEHWTNQRGSETCHLLWYREEYLVVLAERDGFYLLKTAYLTDRSHTRRSLREECDRTHNG